MVLCNVECLERISNYLDVSPLPLEMQENVIVTTERESNETWSALNNLSFR